MLLGVNPGTPFPTCILGRGHVTSLCLSSPMLSCGGSEGMFVSSPNSAWPGMSTVDC